MQRNAAEQCGRGIAMKRKQIQWTVVILQALLVGALFLPAARVPKTDSGTESLSVFEMIGRYAGLGFSNDAFFYMVFACTLPVLIAVFTLVSGKKSLNSAILLTAFYAAASACFYSAAREKIVDSAVLTPLPYIIVFFSLVALFLLLFELLFTDRTEDGKEK